MNNVDFRKAFKSRIKIYKNIFRSYAFDKNKRRGLLNYIIFKSSLKKLDLLVYDNIYPHPISGFRYEEFTVILKTFNKSKIIINPTAYKILNTPISEHIFHINDVILKNEILKGKLISGKNKYFKTKLFYCVFVNNIFENLKWLEYNNIPFVFTLYPGGGFHVDDVQIDKKLELIFKSPMFRKVIVTQKYTEEYLLKKRFCKIDKIKFIFGGVVPQISLKKDLSVKKRYLINKKELDICFCAAKYMPAGRDKGYDVFIDAARSLALKYDFIRFHIIGGFSDDDINVADFNSKIKFYGYKKFEDLRVIYNNMDIIVSPNKAFVLNKGAFDGFPLGTVVEAVLNGVVALVTDELNQNTIFINNKDLILIESTSECIKNKIIHLIDNPDKLHLISKNGMKKFQKIYSNDVQMKPRISLLQNEINK